MSDSVVEIPGQRVLRVAPRAVGLSGAFDVVQTYRTARGFIRVEESDRGPSLKYKCEPPAEVVGILDRGVHPSAAPRSHAMGGVADEKHPSDAIARRDLR